MRSNQHRPREQMKGPHEADLISALADDDATTTQSICRAVNIKFLETDAGLVVVFRS